MLWDILYVYVVGIGIFKEGRSIAFCFCIGYRVVHMFLAGEDMFVSLEMYVENFFL